jgi:hypothetical protein
MTRDEAVQRIKQAIEEKSTELDLSDLGLEQSDYSYPKGD